MYYKLLLFLFIIFLIYLAQLIFYAFPYVGEMVFWEAYEDLERTSEVVLLETPTISNYDIYFKKYKDFLSLDRRILFTRNQDNITLKTEGQRGAHASTSFNTYLTMENLRYKSILFEEGPAYDYEENSLLEKSNIFFPFKASYSLHNLTGPYSDGDLVKIGFGFDNDLANFLKPELWRATPLLDDPYYSYKDYIRVSYPEDDTNRSNHIYNKRRYDVARFNLLEFPRQSQIKSNEKLEDTRGIIKKIIYKNFKRNMKKHIGKVKALKLFKLYYNFTFLKKKFILPEKILLVRKNFIDSFCYYSQEERRILRKVKKVYIKREKVRENVFKAKLDDFKQPKGVYFEEEKYKYEYYLPKKNNKKFSSSCKLKRFLKKKPYFFSCF